MKRRRFHPKVWVVMALTSALIMAITISTIVFVYRVLLEREYVRGLRRQLSEGLHLLVAEDFSAEICNKVSESGIHLLVLEEETGAVIYTGNPNEPIFRGEKGVSEAASVDGTPMENDARYLQMLVREKLNQKDGSVFVSGRDRRMQFLLASRDIYLIGRSGNRLYALYLPVESSAATVNLAIRYATLVGIAGWLFGLIIIYVVSWLMTRPYRSIAQIAGQIADLDFSKRCKPTPTRELNDLSNSINTMSDRLQTAVEKLRSTNEQLSVELEERTHQQQVTTELLANLSHDLKTPIAIISGYAEGLQEGVARTDAQREVYYGMILKESEHMQNIVQRMLALGRVESGNIPLMPENFDLAAMLDEVLALFRREIQRLGLQIEQDYPRPLMAHTDYESVRQSVINYVQNAIYHINQGNRVRICAHQVEDQVQLQVQNSSAPLSQEELTRVWDKLYRGDTARQRSRGEAGLGLAIVKGNMERLGLGYGVRNLDGMVEFYLCLPGARTEFSESEES